jgi:hypothetical protein
VDRKTLGRLVSLLTDDEHSSLGAVLAAATNWNPRDAYFSEIYSLFRKHFEGGVLELYSALQKAPKTFGASTIEEFVLGYVPLDGASLSDESHDRLASWYDCLGEAFRLVGVHDPEDFGPLAADVNALAERIAEILIPVSAAWRTLRPSQK